MHIQLLSVGKFKSDGLKAQEDELIKRLQKSPFKIKRIELRGASEQGDIESIKRLEAKEILAKVTTGDILVALDERGGQMTSVAFSKWLQTQMNSGKKGIIFVIGGAYGLHQSVAAKASIILSLSELTFPYQLARLILIEQIYRATSLLNGSGYHKE